MYKAIYIDTNIFFSCKFNVVDGPLRDLGNLAFKLGIELWSSDIALAELQVAIRDRFNDVFSAFERAAGVLRYSDEFASPDERAITQAIKNAYAAVNEYFHHQDVMILQVEDLDETDIRSVFSDYFNSRGCFSKKKRAEFPDAFQIAMLLRKVKTGESIAVLTDDKDFKSALAEIKEITIRSSIQQVISDLRDLQAYNDKS
jgi:hypothetical protein